MFMVEGLRFIDKPYRVRKKRTLNLKASALNQNGFYDGD